MNNAITQIPKPSNEPIYNYKPGSKERELLKSALTKMAKKEIEIPLIFEYQG